MRNPNIDICSFSVHISDSSQDKVRQKLTLVTITTGGQVSGVRSAHFHENIRSPDTNKIPPELCYVSIALLLLKYYTTDGVLACPHHM